jgi:hypothetical protein
MTNKLSNIKNFDQLIHYLEEELDWPCQEYGFDEITFKYTPEELGIKEEDSVQIKQIHQLRPFFQGQPWGIFFIEFEKKRLPIALLRRVLSHLVVKRRASANPAEQAVWNIDNLLFISAFGDEASEQREIAFAHFNQDSGDLPTLKVLGWDGADTILKMEYVDHELHNKLHWPLNPKDFEAWKNQWSDAFRHKPGHVIRTTVELADRLAKLARGIRSAAEILMAHETEKGSLRRLHKAFQTALIHDLTEADFADTYAQTITYGLLTAAISRTDMSGGINGTTLVAENVADMVPITNPFLKEMLETFIHAGDRKGGIQFDELGVQDIVDLLRGEETDLPAILRDFNNKAPGEDPVIHFYEHFLSAYNKKLKIQRGVFYTPKPVVAYIVHSVHELLKTEFGLEDGLADTTTWFEMQKKIPGLNRPEFIKPDSPFVMILDPATGTATFLVEVIDIIFHTLEEKWDKEGKTKPEKIKAWNEYVPKHLLPRLYGYELMMAPYAIAHMKVGLKLYETGYFFSSNERVRIFLTNSLEEPSLLAQQDAANLFEALGHEAKAVNDIKQKVPFTVLLGNPPYSGNSSNSNRQSNGKLNFIGKLLFDYYKVDNKPLGEKNPKWLQDDYVKFLRFAQWRINLSGIGVIAMITNHGYIDNPTFRGMRQQLMNNFSRINILDLHGNSKKRELSPNGTKDENVFDIQQGVAICLLVKNLSTIKTADVSSCDLFGLRENKYKLLMSYLGNLNSDQWKKLNPQPNFFIFKNQDDDKKNEYEKYIPLTKILPINVLGFQTHRDEFAIEFEKEKLWDRINEMRESQLDDKAFSEKYSLVDNRDWKISKARVLLRQKTEWNEDLIECLYRPFDWRTCYFSEVAMDYPRRELKDHVQARDNLILGVGRQGMALGDIEWQVVCCSKEPIDANIFRRGGVNLFPIYLFPTRKSIQKGIFDLMDVLPGVRRSNISEQFITLIHDRLNLEFTHDGTGDLITNIGPEDIFYYLYSILHSPTYRIRYAEFLKTDFPHLPLTSNIELLRILCKKGSGLATLHLFRAINLNAPVSKFVGLGNNTVQIGYPKFENNIVLINSSQGFELVPKNIWEFQIGGYQVCHKWLKDRRGRQLSEEDIIHYQKILVTLKETIRLMSEIDQVIEEYSGWPIK